MSFQFQYCFRIFILFLSGCLMFVPAMGRNYYFSAKGNDNHAGTSAATAFQSITKMNSLTYAPGDSILLQAGDTFAGNIYVSPSDSGTAAQPVVFSVYGAGNAAVNAGTGTGFYAYNCGGIEIHHLNFYSASSNTGEGVFFYTDRADGHKFRHIRIADGTITGFGDCGILIGSYDKSYPGFQDIQISYINAIQNAKKGVFTYDYAGANSTLYGHKNLDISHCTLIENGIEGMVLSGVDSGLVKYCRASYTGYTTHTGDAGIWAYDANNITFQYCISDHITTTGSDGEGFDLDGGTQNCVIQYCYAYQNASCGFMHCDYPGSRQNNKNIIRYCISENDGRKAAPDLTAFQFISWGTGLDSCYMYNNTAFISDNGAYPVSAMQGYILTGYAANPNIRHCLAINNILYVNGSDNDALVNLIDGNSRLVDSNILFAGNCYFATNSKSLQWVNNTKTYTSLLAWQDSTGQEVYQGGKKGYYYNPGLQGAGGGGSPLYPDSLSYISAYKLKSASAMIGRGLNIDNILPFKNTVYDFYGDTLYPYHQCSVGADEPQPPKTPAPAFSVLNTCFGDTSLFINSSKNAISYIWYLGDGYTDSTASPSHKYAKAGIYTVKLVATSIYGNKDSLIKAIEIFNQPTAHFNAANVCLHDSTRFADSSSNAVSFHWDFGEPFAKGANADTSGLVNPVHLYQKSGSFTVRLMVTAHGGCMDSVSKTIRVYSLPVAKFSTNGACANMPVHFIDSSIGAVSYLWSFGDSIGSTLVNPMHLYASGGMHHVKLSISSVNGCLDSSSENFIVNPAPNPRFIAKNVCLGDTMSFIDSSTNAVSYYWNFGDSSMINTSQMNPRHRYARSGSYPVALRVISNAGCVDSLSKTVQVYPIPSASWTYSNNRLAYHFLANDSTLTDYQWTFGDNTSGSGFNVNHSYLNPGTYEVKLIVQNNNGCEAEKEDSIIVQQSGINTCLPSNVINLECAPNPFSGQIVIRYTLMKEDMVNIILYAESGEKIAGIVNQFQPAGSYTIQFNAAAYHLSAGMFMLRIQTSEGVVEEKLLKD